VALSGDRFYHSQRQSDTVPLATASEWGDRAGGAIEKCFEHVGVKTSRGTIGPAVKRPLAVFRIPERRPRVFASGGPRRAGKGGVRRPKSPWSAHG